jgi:3-(3-hydroxy-phenyl)propionate hydroxylase
LLLRPDRYIAAIFDKTGETKAAESLQSLFGIAQASDQKAESSITPVFH